nr:ATP-binding protein [Ramlibacter ginsenosidimutans]
MWSPQARRIHEFSADRAVSIWEALDFIDLQDRPRVFDAALQCFRLGEPLDIVVGLTASTGRRKRVRLTAFLASQGPDGTPSLKGTIQELPGISPGSGDYDATAQRLLSALLEWEIFGRAIPHELKAPLGIANGFAEALHDRERGALSDTGRLYLSRVLNAQRQLGDLLDALLQFSPLATRPVQRETVDVSQLASEAIALLRSRDADREVHVEIEQGLTVAGDPELLRLLLSNLLGNAWKFTQSRPDARISLRCLHGAQGAVYCVQDNGAGFDMRDATRLFTPFERLHERHHFDGSGVGLAIVRRVVERHGGSVWATSSPGHGASFFFTFASHSEPLAVAQGQAYA